MNKNKMPEKFKSTLKSYKGTWTKVNGSLSSTQATYSSKSHKYKWTLNEFRLNAYIVESKIIIK